MNKSPLFIVLRRTVKSYGCLSSSDVTVWAWFLHLCFHETISYPPQHYPLSFCSLHRAYSLITGKCIQQTILLSHSRRVLSSLRHFVYELLARWRHSTANDLTLKNKQIGLRFVFLVSAESHHLCSKFLYYVFSYFLQYVLLWDEFKCYRVRGRRKNRRNDV